MTCALADLHGELRPGGRCPECGLVRLALRGPVPCKKSKYRRSRGGGLHLDRATSATIGGLVLQARSQWRREPVEHPEMVIVHLQGPPGKCEPETYASDSLGSGRDGDWLDA